jgi:hypothetical protein
MRKFSGESFIVGLTLLMIICPELAMARTGGEELQEVVAKPRGYYWQWWKIGGLGFGNWRSYLFGGYG